MIELKIRPGEKISEFIQRCLTELNKRSTIPDHIIYEFNNIKTEGDYIHFVELTKIEFNSYNTAHLTEPPPEYRLDSSTHTIHTMDRTNQHYIDVNKKQKRYNPKLKRLLR